MNHLPSSQGRFKFFRKFAEIFISQGALQVLTTPTANFATVTTGVIYTDSKFATGVSDTGSRFAASVNDSGANCHQYQ
jgi:hypothetical protein